MSKVTQKMDILDPESPVCNLCGADKPERYLSLSDRYYGRSEEFTMVRCLYCGLLYLNPRPGREAMSRYYEADYYSYTALQDFSVRTSFSGWKGKLFGEIYRDSLFGKLLRSYFVSWRGNWRWFYAADPEKRGGRVLDIGCGSGQTLLLFKKFGWEAYGIDISEQACEVGRKHGLKIHQGEFEDLSYPDEFFDFIWMNHVLNICEILRKLLKK